MRILTRYILGEVAAHAAIGVLIFTFVLFTKDLGKILELAVRDSAPLPAVAEVFLLTLPVALTITIPAGVLVGILIGLSRLAADSEVTAMRASGIGVWSFLRMLSLFVLAAWLLALVNGVYVAPRSEAQLARLQDRLKTSQASFEVQPRVFYEGFPKLVLYVQDVHSGPRVAVWKGVFLADMSAPGQPRVTQAEQGILVSEGPTTLHLHLSHGSTHETDPKSADHYQISTFAQTDIPIELPASDNKADNEPVPVGQVSTRGLREEARTANPMTARWYLIEFHRRLALPTACVVLALVGIPLGLSSKKGGKSSGFVLTIGLVFAYYSASLIGVSLARQGRLSPGMGVWLADALFLVGGAALLWRAERRPLEIGAWLAVRNPLRRRHGGTETRGHRAEGAFERASSRRRVFSGNFPMILDDYVLRDFFLYLGMILATFLMLLLVFTLFELLGDILRNHISPLVVGAYLLEVSPFFLYNIAPLSMLLAVLVTFGLMERSNEVTAVKATGISIYRIITPVVVAAALIGASLFFFDQFYLPHANKRQDALRNQIKGRPPQTYLRPDRKWIFGEHSDIYYYQFFDADRDQFANISVFQFEPRTLEINRRVYAERAHWSDATQRWIFEQGWERAFRGSAIANYTPFEVSTFPQFSEPPAYFKKEVKQSSEMNYEELRRYIHDLEQSGFDVVRLRVQLQKKFAFPAIALVMAVLAIPFALSAGKRGAIQGVATAVGIGLVYWTVSGLFEAMGNLSQLPPPLAAWSPDLIFALVGGYMILKVPT
ncbi:MAG TPA: LptF/LptG family permease [Terriglobales bacterium]|nr:LptF/LptG family permease [Terriglobales bacterium]